MNIRSMTELLPILLSANLVGPGLVGVERSKSNESAIMRRSLV